MEDQSKWSMTTSISQNRVRLNEPKFSPGGGNVLTVFVLLSTGEGGDFQPTPPRGEGFFSQLYLWMQPR